MIVTNVMIVMIVIKDFGNEKNGYVVIYNKIYFIIYYYIAIFFISKILNDNHDNHDIRDNHDSLGNDASND